MTVLLRTLLVSLLLLAAGGPTEAKSDEDKRTEDAALEIMLKSLEDKKAGTKQKILRNIARLGDKDGIPPLIYIMLDPSEEVDTRREAAKAAMVLGGEVNYGPILKLLDGSPFHCKKNIRILSEISDRRFVRPLAKYTALWDIDNSCRKFAAVSYLKLLGDGDDIDLSFLKKSSGEWVLMKIAGDEKSRYQEKAIYILGMTGSERVHNVIIEALYSKRSNVQTAALNAMDKIGSKDFIEPIGDVLSKTHSVSLKELCVKTLYDLAKADALKEIRTSFKKGSDQHKIIILRYLRSLNEKRSKALVGALLRQIKDRKKREKLIAQSKESLWD